MADATDAEALELDALWSTFRDVVNMTSQELAAWLRTAGAAEARRPPHERTGGVQQGRAVLAILRKRQMDLTERDIGVMSEVVETVRAERAAGPRPAVPDSEWRYRLMSLGHDPLRSPRHPW